MQPALLAAIYLLACLSCALKIALPATLQTALFLTQQSFISQGMALDSAAIAFRSDCWCA